jgi:hypothetical protein
MTPRRIAICNIRLSADVSRLIVAACLAKQEPDARVGRRHGRSPVQPVERDCQRSHALADVEELCDRLAILFHDLPQVVPNPSPGTKVMLVAQQSVEPLELFFSGNADDGTDRRNWQTHGRSLSFHPD